MHKTIREIVEIVQGEWLGHNDELDMVVEGVTKDSRIPSVRSLYIPIIGERFDGHQFVQDALANGSIASFWKRAHHFPPLSGPIILVDDPVHALHRLASHYRQEVGCKVIAVTGSNGKTTTKDLIASVLKQKYITHATIGNLNNHIGVPLTILSMPSNTEVAVIEMGMNHFGEIEGLSKLAKPDYAVITNIGESHLEFLGSRAGIANAKLEILAGMDEKGTLLFPDDEPLIYETEAFKRFPGRKVSCGFSTGDGLQAKLVQDLGLEGTKIEFESSGEKFSIPVPGIHNAQNALYAIGIGTLLHMTSSEINNGLKQSTMTGMRMERLTGKNGVTIINDAYNASPTSIRAALRFFANLQGWKRKIVVLGDVGELGSYGPKMHEELGGELNPSLFPLVFVTGTLCKHMVVGAVNKGYNQVIHFEHKVALIEHLKPYLDKDTIILLKASRFMKFDQIVNALME